MTTPVISIVMPTFNRLQFLRPAVDSVFAQTFTDWELIIADDGSGAETRTYLQGLDDPRVTVLWLPHTGKPSVVSNIALREARGEFVAFLDSDDLWLPKKLETQLESLRERPERRWSYTKFAVVDGSSRPIVAARIRDWPTPSGWILEKLLEETTVIAQPSVVVSRQLLEQLGAFDEELVMCYDDELWFRLAAHSEIDGIDEPLTLIRRHEHHSGGDMIAWRDRRRVFEKALRYERRQSSRTDPAQAPRANVRGTCEEPGGFRQADERPCHSLHEPAVLLGVPQVLARRTGRDCTRICAGGRTHARPSLPAKTPLSLGGPMSLAAEAWSILTPSQRRRVLAAQIISLAMAFSTITGIAAIAPFFAVLGDPRLIDQNILLHWLYLHGGFSDQRGFIAVLGVAFISLVLIANLINALGSLAMNRLAMRIGNQLQTAMFADYLSRPYSFHAGTNSATLVKNIVYESTRVTNGILLNGLMLVANLVTASFIVLAIVLLNPTVAIAMIAVLAGGYALIYLAVRNRVLRFGRAQSHFAAEQAQIVNEGFGAIKELIVLHVQSFFRDRFERVSSALALAAANCQVVAQSPRHFMECVAAAVLVGIALVLGGREDGVGPWLGQLTFLAFAAYRLLPTLQQVFAMIVKIRADRPAFALIAPDLRHARAAHTDDLDGSTALRQRVARASLSGNPAERCVVPLCGRSAVGSQGRVIVHSA